MHGSICYKISAVAVFEIQSISSDDSVTAAFWYRLRPDYDAGGIIFVSVQVFRGTTGN